MSLILTSAPEIEPVSLAEAKAHLRLDTATEDAVVASLITTSRLHIETALGLALVDQTWSIFADRLSHRAPLDLPIHPVRAVLAVRTHHRDAAIITHPLSHMTLDANPLRPRLLWDPPPIVPSPLRTMNGYEISVRAGFGPHAGDVPAPIRQALLMLVAHWFEHRDPVEIGAAKTQIPTRVSDLLAPWKSLRP